MKTNSFDPLAYIENAFLDTREADKNGTTGESNGVKISRYLQIPDPNADTESSDRTKFRKTEMSAPRPRRVRKKNVEDEAIDEDLQTVWSTLPRNVEFLSKFFDDSVTANYYRGEFKESRLELIRRLLDPELSLEETSRLLGVCPATVRRYTNRGWLSHHRTQGGQRRFRLSNVVNFVQEHGRFPEEA